MCCMRLGVILRLASSLHRNVIILTDLDALEKFRSRCANIHIDSRLQPIAVLADKTYFVGSSPEYLGGSTSFL